MNGRLRPTLAILLRGARHRLRRFVNGDPRRIGHRWHRPQRPGLGERWLHYTQGTYLEGFEFTANQPISVTALGAYDSNLSSLTNGAEQFKPVPVALYDLTTHTQLVVATVSATDTPHGVYRYATLSSPITLNTSDTTPSPGSRSRTTTSPRRRWSRPPWTRRSPTSPWTATAGAAWNRRARWWSPTGSTR